MHEIELIFLKSVKQNVTFRNKANDKKSQQFDEVVLSTKHDSGIYVTLLTKH